MLYIHYKARSMKRKFVCYVQVSKNCYLYSSIQFKLISIANQLCRNIKFQNKNKPEAMVVTKNSLYHYSTIIEGCRTELARKTP